ncbi:reverse transcriptase domain-containing protein [Tanacetum coccineum]
MTFEHLTKEVLVEVLAKRSIDNKEVLQVDTKEGESWMTPIHEYLLSGLLPKDPRESKKIIINAPQYKLIKESLYKKSFFTPWLCCIAHQQVNNIIKEIHEGSCGLMQNPAQCIPRPLPTATEGLKFLAIGVEHSTKWVEAKPLTTINVRQVEKFAWEYIICRFRVPRTIKSKEEKHFKEGIFADLCKGLKITQSFSPTTKHTEIMNHIEKQLTQSQQGWVDDLARVLWVYRTLPRNSQKETPFSLTYGSEAIIPITESFVPKDNRSSRRMLKEKKAKKWPRSKKPVTKTSYAGIMT